MSRLRSALSALLFRLDPRCSRFHHVDEAFDLGFEAGRKAAAGGATGWRGASA